MSRAFVTRLAAVACLLAAGLALAAPAGVGAASQAPRIHLRFGASTNWAGYADETNLSNPQSGVVTDVQGTWTVPSVDCSSGDGYAAIWVGIDGDSSNTVEQTGTEQDCVNGAPAYSAWYEFYPKRSYNISLAVSPGDVMFAEVRYAGGSFTATLTNETTGASYSVKQKTHAARSSAEWIVEAPYSGGVLPLANFGTATFSNAQATISGVTGGIATWPNEAITMETSSGVIKAATSSVRHGGFSVTWQHA